jgi:hypothetical protein
VPGAGAVGGTIRDPDGEGLPDVEVVLHNQHLGVRRAVETTVDGVFDVTGVPPAVGYKLKLSRKKFAGWESPEFEIPTGERVNFALTMTPQADAAKAEAVEGLPPVAAARESAGEILGPLQVDDLPVRQRRWADLTLLAPAVTAWVGEPHRHALLVDGVEVNSGSWRAHAAAAEIVSQEAIQGVQVFSSGAPAGFGHTLGGAVNAVTRSGGAGFHGSAYQFFSNHSLSAIDRYALGNKLFQRENQGGFNLGGPIAPGRLYFFSNVEYLDGHRLGLNRITSPLIADSTGAAVASSNCKATAAQCAAASKFIQSQMNALTPRDEHLVNGLLRIDYRRSERNTISLTGNLLRSRAPEGAQNLDIAPNGGLLWNGTTRRKSTFARVEWTGAPSDTVVNQLRFGVYHDRFADSGSTALPSTGRAAITVAGVSLGAANAYPDLFSQHRSQLEDHFTISGGSHTATVGVEWRNARYALNTLPDSAGAYTYPSLTAFAQDFGGTAQKNYTLFTQTAGAAARDYHSDEFAFYLQDAWQVSDRLRVMAGVRWGRPSYTQPLAYNSTYYNSRKIPSPNINAEPRISASYLLDERTVVRVGWGMYYAPLPSELLDAVFLGNGEDYAAYSASPAQSAAPVFPNAMSGTYPAGTKSLIYAASKMRTAFTRQLNFSIERNVVAGITASAGYIGSDGVKLWTANDTNLSTTTSTATYSIEDASGRKTGVFTIPVWTAKNDANYAHIYQVENGGASWYRALVLQARKPMSRGVTVQASYTWSHAIDNVGGTLIYGAVPVSTYSLDYAADKGSSATDQRHRLVVNWIWQPRAPRDLALPLRLALDGWAISSVATLASSQPSTALVLTNGQQQFAKTTLAFTETLSGTGGWSRVPFLPVNSLYSDPGYTLDARLSRTIGITERIKATVMFEGFNVFNSQFDTGVNTVAYTASSGVLRAVAGVGSGNSAQSLATGSNARLCRAGLRVTF